MPMETSPSKLRSLATTLRQEADQLDDAAATLESALAVISTRTNAGQIAESTIGTGLTPTPAVSVPQPGGKTFRIPWGKQAAALDPEFIAGLQWSYEQIGLEPDKAVTVMKFESNLDPAARNPKSSASGLIQFMSATAVQLGTTIENVRAMGAMEQLGLAHRYWKQFKTKWEGTTLCDYYLAVLYPKAMGLPHDAKVFVKGTDTYAVNAGLDTNKDGYVSKAEICARMEALYEEGLKPGNYLDVTFN